jgi:hypothetical protein
MGERGEKGKLSEEYLQSRSNIHTHSALAAPGTVAPLRMTSFSAQATVERIGYRSIRNRGHRGSKWTTVAQSLHAYSFLFRSKKLMLRVNRAYENWRRSQRFVGTCATCVYIRSIIMKEVLLGLLLYVIFLVYVDS